MDGATTKAPLGGEKVGPNSTDRGKLRTKRSLLTGGCGLPLGLAVSGANVIDFKLFWNRRLKPPPCRVPHRRQRSRSIFAWTRATITMARARSPTTRPHRPYPAPGRGSIRHPRPTRKTTKMGGGASALLPEPRPPHPGPPGKARPHLQGHAPHRLRHHRLEVHLLTRIRFLTSPNGRAKCCKGCRTSVQRRTIALNPTDECAAMRLRHGTTFASA